MGISCLLCNSTYRQYGDLSTLKVNRQDSERIFLGHSDITTTLNVYGHVLGGDMDRLGQVMDSVLSRPTKRG